MRPRVPPTSHSPSGSLKRGEGKRNYSGRAQALRFRALVKSGEQSAVLRHPLKVQSSINDEGALRKRRVPSSTLRSSLKEGHIMDPLAPEERRVERRSCFSSISVSRIPYFFRRLPMLDGGQPPNPRDFLRHDARCSLILQNHRAALKSRG